MGNQLTSKGALGYQGTNAQMPPNVFVFNRAPTTQDYQNFEIGDFWVYRISRTSNNSNLYVLLGVVQHDANWALVTGSSGIVETLTGNTGGAVGPDAAHNINVVGDGTTVTVAGNPGTNTLTISTVATGTVESLTTDDTHVVTPTAGTIKIHGGTGIATTGTVGPNTVTVSTTGAVATLYTEDSGNATPSSNNLNIVGAGGITTSGSGSTVTITGSGGTVTTLHTDDGHNVTATAGVINIAGDGLLVSTTGTVGPNTVTIDSKYATGSWTPTLTFGGSSTGITYNTQVGSYVKIGKVVFIYLGIILTSKGAQTGDAKITGLPYTVTGSTNIFPGVINIGNITLTAGYTNAVTYFDAGATDIILSQNGSGGTQPTITDTNFANNSALSISGTYITT